MFIGLKSSWRKGLGKALVHALKASGFEHLGLERIQAGCYVRNLQPLRIFLNAGYTVESSFRRHVMDNGHRTGFFWLGTLKDEFI